MEHLDIVRTVLGTLEHRRSFSPGMFAPLAPLFARLGYETAAIYITDDYPDRMTLAAVHGDGERYPLSIDLGRALPLAGEAAAALGSIPNLMVERLFSHERELGVLVATTPEAGRKETREAFALLAEAISTMAYIERLSAAALREREERDIFFAQSLVSRLLVQDVPKIKHLRIGCDHVRSLEAGGDFFDFIAKPDGTLLGFVGSCSGTGLRTVLEVCGIMREIHRSLHRSDSPARVLSRINTLLVEEKRRRHQASLCVFRVSAVERTIRLAKSGCMGILLCGPGSGIENISASGTSFLGMAPGMEFQDEEYGFVPEQSLFCVTEGFYTSRDCTDQDEQMRRFIGRVAVSLEARRKKPLANAVFERVERADDPMIALSVEFLNNRESVRLFARRRQD